MYLLNRCEFQPHVCASSNLLAEQNPALQTTSFRTEVLYSVLSVFCCEVWAGFNNLSSKYLVHVHVEV